MAILERVRAVWSGFPGGPGVSTFYVADAITQLPRIRTFFDGIKGILPTDVTVSFPNTGDRIDEVDGSLAGSWTAGSTPANVVGTAAVVYGAPMGLMVNWRTSGIVSGRRLRGRTFIVPAAGLESSTGAPTTTGLTTLSTAADTLIGATFDQIKIWSRPRTLPTPRSGSSAFVTGKTVPAKFVVMRSRRD